LAGVFGSQGHTQDRLSDLTQFGSNPGQLRARIYTPADLPAGAPLVVVLHGCTQTAADYDHGSGWSSLADRHGFALLFPEQQRSNNPNLCFNWFRPGDCRRDDGEPLSIRQMIETFAASRDLDRRRIFVTGLSAGGAMSSVMLAAYPEVFAGGAIIAGLPYGCAKTIPEAFDRMQGKGLADGDGLVRGASGHSGPWPIVSVWHGSADQTVHPDNAEAIVRQWRLVHGLDEAPARTEVIDTYPRRTWCDGNGRAVIEMYTITGMGHGTPLATQGAEGCGASGPHMLEASISSTQRIAEFWGLAAPLHRDTARETSGTSWGRGIGSIQQTITDALRAAGLIK
jgi:poly(hydroxyalkanoate) depolymerase family esterase